MRKTATATLLMLGFIVLIEMSGANPGIAAKKVSNECAEWHEYIFDQWLGAVRTEVRLRGADAPVYPGAGCPDNLTKKDLRILRNAVYARHGRLFKSQDLQYFFYVKNGKRFKMNPKYKDSMLTKIDKDNIAYIQEMEKQAQ